MLVLNVTYKAKIEEISQDPEVFPVVKAGCWGSETLTFASDIAALTFVQTHFRAKFVEELVATTILNLTTAYQLVDDSTKSAILSSLLTQNFGLGDLTAGSATVTELGSGETQINKI